MTFIYRHAKYLCWNIIFMAYSGYFKPKNPTKYRGNPTNIVYRSLWERKFMVFCDNNPSILQWGSEEIIIPYRAPDGSEKILS